MSNYHQNQEYGNGYGSEKSRKKPKRKKKIAKKKPKEDLFLELTGKVFIIEKLGNKELNKTELDGNLVLRCILKVLEQSLASEPTNFKE